MITNVAKFVLIIAFLMLWSGAVQHVVKGKKKLGPLTEPILVFSNFTSTIKKAVDQVLLPPATYIQTEDDFSTINKLNYDVFGLISTSNNNDHKIELKNFRDKSVKHSWNIQREVLAKYFSQNLSDRVVHPIVSENYGLIFHLNEKPVAMKLDSLSNIIWTNDEFIYHHSLNVDHEQNLWIPAVNNEREVVLYDRSVSIEDKTKKEYSYRDDIAVKLDAKTGKTLWAKSISDILLDNELGHLIYKSQNPWDPYHLNDIEPVLETSDYFEQGDILLSLRHLSVIVLYRPSTNKVIEVIDGPFTLQHDVDVVSPTSITISNNNASLFDSQVFTGTYPKGIKIEKSQSPVTITHSNVLVYDFSSKKFEPILEHLFEDNNIFTKTEGKSEILKNGDLFFEEQNSGILWILNKDEVVMKEVIPSDLEGYHLIPNWTRIYQEFNFQ